MAPEGIGGLGALGERNFSSGMRAANYTLVYGVSFSWRSVACKTQRLQFDDYPGTKQRTSRSSDVFGVGKFRILDRWISDARRFREAARFLATPTGGSLDRFWQPALLTPARER